MTDFADDPLVHPAAPSYHANGRQHFLKTDPDAWDAVESGIKTAEFRKMDRDFRVGDALFLFRGMKCDATEQYIIKRITHIVTGGKYGIPDGYAMLSLAPGILGSDEPTW